MLPDITTQNVVKMQAKVNTKATTPNDLGNQRLRRRFRNKYEPDLTYVVYDRQIFTPQHLATTEQTQEGATSDGDTSIRLVRNAMKNSFYRPLNSRQVAVRRKPESVFGQNIPANVIR